MKRRFGRTRALGLICMGGLAIATTVITAPAWSTYISSIPQISSANGTGTVRPVHWSLVAVEGERAIKVRVKFGYCAGDPKPRVEKVRQLRRSDAVIITVFGRFPQSKDEDGVCAGLRLRIDRKLKLNERLEGRDLLDGSSSPPVRRWPPHTD